MDRLKIYNGTLLTPYRRIENGCVICEDGVIRYAGKNTEPAADCREIDAHGQYISPGFIDIHTHGCGGYDFMDGTAEAFCGAAAEYARHGVTAFLPTTLCSTQDSLKNTIKCYEEAKKTCRTGARMPGLHLEGPYFAQNQRGAQDPRYIKNPEPTEYERILDWTDGIIRWSAAPELPGGLEFGRRLRGRGILPSIAHSDAVSPQVEEAFENGYTHVTHLYSGMSGVRRINAYRFGGVIESALGIEEMTVEIIADGAHLPAELLKLIYKIKGASRTALVSDSMRAAGMPEGESIIGGLSDGQRVIVEDGVAKLPDRASFAGSVATADRLVRNMIKLAGAPITDAVRMMTSTPASIIGVRKEKGALSPGLDADIVIFDENVNVSCTVVGGTVAYKTDRLH